MFNLYTVVIEGEDYIVLQNGGGEQQVHIAFNREYAGRVAVAMLHFTLGLMPEEATTNEEETING